MRVFVGIPLAQQLEGEISQLSSHAIYQEYFRRSRVEPHITLKAPQTLAAVDIETWKRAAQSAIKGCAPININTGGLFFITPMTLCLRVETEPLCTLHRALVDALKPYDSNDIIPHERQDFIGHVTLGRATKRILTDERTAILKDLNTPIRPRDFTVKIVRLYARENVDEGYVGLADIQLSDNL